jgi:predicted phage-related endonuclease
MEMGLILEPAIATACERKTGMKLVADQVQLRSEQYPFMLATLDRLTEEGEIVELKAAGTWASRDLGDDGDSESLPEHWILQAQHQMIVAGKRRVTFAVLMPTLQVRIYPVERNPALCHALVAIEETFWAHVREDVAPEELVPQDAAMLADIYRGWHGSTVLGDRDSEAATDYLSLGAEIRQLERRREEARARLLLSMEDCAVGILPDGREVHRKVITTSDRMVKGSRYPRLTIKEMTP